MNGHLEILSGLIRVGPEVLDDWSGPYTHTVTLAANRRHGTLKGLVSTGFTGAHRRAVLDTLRRYPQFRSVDMEFHAGTPMERLVTIDLSQDTLNLLR